MSGLRPVRGESGLRPVRGVSGLRPGWGMSALRPVRGVSGLRPVRSVSGLRPDRGVSALRLVRGMSGLRLGRGMSGLCPVRGESALRPDRGVSALRPVRGMSGLCPGWGVSGLRSERIISGLHVAAVLLVFFLLLRPDWLPRWAYWGALALGAALTLGEMALDYRRRRPRRRWRDTGLVLLSLSVVWTSSCRRSFSGECPTRRSWPAPRWDWVSLRSSHASSACCAGGVCAPRLKCAFGS